MSIFRTLLPSTLFALAALQSSVSAADEAISWSAEEQAIIARMESIATDLPNKGWNAYVDYFAEGYDNWIMTSETIRGREQFISLVRGWYDDGNGASSAEVVPLSIDFLGSNFAYVRSHENETFFGPNADEGRKRFEGFKASVWKKEDDGVWRVYRTSLVPVNNGE